MEKKTKNKKKKKKQKKNVVGVGVCIGSELYPTERSSGPGKDMSHPGSSYQRIDIIRRLLGRGGQNNCQKDNQCSPHFNIDIT